MSDLSVRDLKARLAARGVDCRSALYKSDLLDLWQKAQERPGDLDSQAQHGAQDLHAQTRHAQTQDEAQSPQSGPSVCMSVSDLKNLIRHFAGRPGTCWEKKELFLLAQSLLNTRKCPICLEQLLISPSEIVVPFPCCDVVMHQGCWAAWILSKTDPMICLGCGKQMNEDFIQKNLSLSEWEKHKTRQTKLAELRSGNRASTDANTVSQMRQLGFRECPKCRSWIEKGPAMEAFGVAIAEGCDKMTCRCGAQFCFRCGSLNAQCNCTGAEHGFFSHKEVMQQYPGASISSPAEFLGNLFK